MAGEERSLLVTQLNNELKEAQAAEAAAAEAAAAQAVASAATAAAAAGNTDTAQLMDTTAAGDDAFDATAQETVDAAGSMTGNITAPAAATVADSTAADDAPNADAPDSVSAVPVVPNPDDIAASMMAAVPASTADPSAAVPTASALDSATPSTITASFPASAPTAGLLPPQDAIMQEPAATPTQLAPPAVVAQSVDVDMTEAVIPQTDGPADDPMGDSASELAPMDFTAAVTEQPAAAAAGDASLTATAAGALVTPAESIFGPAADQAAAVLQLVATDLTPQSQDLPTTADPSAVSTSETAASPAANPVAATTSAIEPEIAVTDDQIKAAWLRSVDETYAVAKEEWQRRKPFEDGIKRPYFHVKPLDLAQLQNWSRCVRTRPNCATQQP